MLNTRVLNKAEYCLPGPTCADGIMLCAKSEQEAQTQLALFLIFKIPYYNDFYPFSKSRIFKIKYF